MELGQLDGAQADLLAAYRLDDKDAAVRRALKLLKNRKQGPANRVSSPVSPMDMELTPVVGATAVAFAGLDVEE